METMEASGRIRRLYMERDTLLERVQRIMSRRRSAPPLSVHVSLAMTPRVARTTHVGVHGPDAEVQKEIVVLRAWLGSFEW